MTAPPHSTASREPALLTAGLRPFFLGGAVWSAVSAPLWVLSYLGFLPSAGFSRAWHMHEMLFGYLAAVVAGFLLTSVPNWTRRPPLIGLPLAILFGLWGAGRLAMLLVSVLGPLLTAIIDSLVLLSLAGFVGREILASSNWRNLGVAVAVALLAAANLASHLAENSPWMAEAAPRAALAAVGFLLTLIGGRITPSFTRNWMSRRGEAALPMTTAGLDRISLILTALALAGWATFPDNRVAGAALIGAGLSNLARLALWRGWRCGAEALVWSLHVGFLWLCLALLVLGLSAMGLTPRSAGVHALSTGAAGMMTLAVMTRASLGHTGRTLTAGHADLAIYALVSLAAMLRLTAGIAPVLASDLLPASAASWSLAFGLFAVSHFRMLTQPRLR